MFKTIADVKRANKEKGGEWFSRNTMKFFKSKIVSPLYGGAYFVTREQYDENSKPRFTIRLARKNGDIETHGQFMEYGNVDMAKDYAKEYAGKNY